MPYLFIAVIIIAGVIPAIITPLKFKFTAWIIPAFICSLIFLYSTTLHGEEGMILLFLYPIIIVCIAFFVTYYLKLLFVYIQRFNTKKRYIISSVIIVTLITTTVNIMWKHQILKLPNSNVRVREVPIEKLDIYTTGWINKKNESGIYLHKIIQASPTQKYLIYSIKNLTYEYRLVKVVKEEESLNINITTHNAENDSYVKNKQAFIIELNEEPKQINIYLDGQKINPMN